MRRTPLNELHKSLGARMFWFAGWDMPLQYTSIIEEHMAVRQHAGAFDVSHMGDLIIRGEGAGELAEELFTNAVRTAPVGRCVYSHILDDDGHILDDTIAAVLGRDEFFMVPNAATTPKIRAWVEKHLLNQELIDESASLAAIAVQGPAAKDVISQLTSADLSTLGSFWATFTRLDKIDAEGSKPMTVLLRDRPMANGDGKGVRAFVSRTGYTGEDGFEVVCENADAVAVWSAILDRGQPLGLVPAGLGARDTLRLEKGFLLSGTDFDGSQTTLQTGPKWVIDWNHEFIGRAALDAQKAKGGYPRLVGMIMKDRGIPRHGYKILTDGAKAGDVTSGTMSPVLRRGIAMGYLPFDLATPGKTVQIKIRDSLVNAETARPPFVKRG